MTEKILLVRHGYVGAMSGHEAWVNTTTDEMVKIAFKHENFDKGRELYCKYVRITIEEVSEEEVVKQYSPS